MSIDANPSAVQHRPHTRGRLIGCKQRRQVMPWLLLLLSACGGGMVGTGTGPQEPGVYQSNKLPDRIGADLPAPLINVQSIAANFGRMSVRDDDKLISEQWLTLNEQIGDIESLRLKSEESMTLIDAVIPDIESQCDLIGESICRLASGRIEGLYTDALIAGIEALYTRALGTAGETSMVLDDLRNELQSRLGSRYELGEIELLPSDGQPYDIDLTTTIRDVLGNSQLRIRTNSSGTRNELTVSRRAGDVFNREFIGFATGLPGERFTYTSDRVVGEGVAERFDVSIVADASAQRRVLLDARIQRRAGEVERDIAYTAQIDNQQGFARSREYATVGDTIRNITLIDESFAADGTLLAGRRCTGRVERQPCSVTTDFTLYGDSGQSVTDSDLYFAASEFDQLVVVNDAIQYEVAGLPESVIDFQVLTDDQALPLVDREVLCKGVQLAPNDVLLYCTAPVDRLSTSVVVAIDRDTGALSRLPMAELVPR